MHQSLEQFDYMALSAAERLLLAQELLDSVFDVVAEQHFTPEQTSQFQGRLDDRQSGAEKGIHWDDVRDSFIAG